MSTEQIAVILAGLSLAVSAHTAWRAHQQGGRAHFTAHWVTATEILYTNHGPGPAESVVLSRVPGPSYGDPYLEPRHAYIAAGQSLSLHHGPRQLAEDYPRCLDISWDDRRRARQKVTIELGDPPRPIRLTPELRSRGAIEAAVRQAARDEIAKFERKTVEAYRRSRRR